MPITTIGDPVRLPNGTIVPLSKAVRAGDFILASGQLGFGEDGKIVAGGVGPQTRQCMDNITALLLDAGTSLAEVARVTIWLTDTADFAAFNAVYAEYFPKNPPARSTVCSALMLPDAKVAIEVTAISPAMASFSQ